MKKVMLSLLFLFSASQNIQAQGLIASGIETGWQLTKVTVGGVTILVAGIPLMTGGTVGIAIFPSPFRGASIVSFASGGVVSYCGYKIMSSGLQGLKDLYGDKKHHEPEKLNNLDEV